MCIVYSEVYLNQQEVDECSGEMMKGERHKIEILKKKVKLIPFILPRLWSTTAGNCALLFIPVEAKKDLTTPMISR